MSVESIESIENDNQETWSQLCGELQDFGVSEAVSVKHKSFIIQWMKEATCDATDSGWAGSVRSGEISLQSYDTSSDVQVEQGPKTNKQPTKSAQTIRVPSTPLAKQVLVKRLTTLMLRPFRSPTAVHRAARDGDLDKIDLALQQGGDINFKDSYSLTPLHWAIIRGHVDVSRRLLERGADPEHRDSDGRTALGVAAWQGIEEIVEVLLEYNANIEAQDAQGLAPLHGAAKNRCPKVCGILLSHGAPVNQRTLAGWTPLHWAARQGYNEIVSIMFNAGADVRAKGKAGETALSLAVSEGHESTVAEVQGLLKDQRA